MCVLVQGLLPRKPSAEDPELAAPFHISYTCKDIGKCLKGCLHIHTKDAQFCYTIHGRQTGYRPPERSMFKSKVNSWLDPSLVASLHNKARKTNFVLSNIKMVNSKNSI